MPEKPFEVIVIGSGATGGVAALTFAEAGIRVLVVEAGPQLTSEQALGKEPLNTFRRVTSLISETHKKQAQHPGYWKANPLLYANEKDIPYTTPDERPFIWTQGRQVGGRSLTWGGITLRLSELDLKASSQDGYGPEWPISYSDLEPHYTALEKKLGVYGHVDELEQLPDGNYLGYLPFTKSEENFARLVKNKLGYQVIHSRGFGPYQKHKDGEWPRSSSPGSTLKEALKTGKVEILTNHIAERLLMKASGECAKGVIVVDRLTGYRKEINAELIILCASTIQSLRFLLTSNESNQSSGFVDPSGMLGHYLMDHVSTCRFFSFPNKEKQNQLDLDKNPEVLSGAGSFFIPFGSISNKESSTDFLRGYGIWGGIDRFEPPSCLKRKPGTKTGFLIGHGEVLARKVNKVELSSNFDKLSIPIPHIDMSWGDNEGKMVSNMNKTIQEIISITGGEMLPLKELIKMPFIEPIIDQALALQEEAPPPGYYIHEVGGARMGLEEVNSVVDKWNRLWRCPNVLVVDGSCWPTSAWQSPTLTMMAITRRACLNAVRNQNEKKGHPNISP